MRARITALLILAAVALGACDVGDSGDERGSRPRQSEVDFDLSGWKTDFSKHSVPLSEFRSGGPPRDGIPPIDEPKPVSQRKADEFLRDREPVLAVEVGHQVRAYPIQIMVWHEIANDQLGGKPIAVTYCPLCNSSLVFDRRVRGRTVTFGTTGNLRKSDLVMWDRQTESWWQQLTADAVVGRLTGTRLKVLPSQTLAWRDFKARYPMGDVLSRDTGTERDYGANPYERYDDPRSAPFLFQGKANSALPAKERVAAVFADRKVVVASFSLLENRRALNEEVGDVPAAILFKRGVLSALDAPSIEDSRDVGTAAAFDRRLGGRTLEFEPAAAGRFRDRQTRSVWDITGRAVSGRLRGERLRPLRHDEQFWFALGAFVPDARIVKD